MTEEVTIICDRCGTKVKGIKGEFLGKPYTGGFYDLTDDYWKQFALNNESKICDDCMFSDSRYQNR